MRRAMWAPDAEAAPHLPEQERGVGAFRVADIAGRVEHPQVACEACNRGCLFVGCWCKRVHVLCMHVHDAFGVCMAAVVACRVVKSAHTHKGSCVARCVARVHGAGRATQSRAPAATPLPVKSSTG